MARSRRGASPARPAARAAPRPVSHAPPPPQYAPPPQPHYSAPPPAPQQSSGGGMLSGIGGMVVQGMALGTGSAMAHRAVDAVLGSSHPAPAEAAQAAQTIVEEKQPCAEQAKAFSDCMSFSSGDMGACQQYFDAMQSCRRHVQAV